MMEALSSSETFVFTRATRRDIPGYVTVDYINNIISLHILQKKGTAIPVTGLLVVKSQTLYRQPAHR
jgi:hypothetical protein